MLGVVFVKIIDNITLSFVSAICIGDENLNCLSWVLKPSLRIHRITILTYLQIIGYYQVLFIFFSCEAWTPFWVMAFPYGVSRSHTLDPQHSVDSSGRVIGPSQRSLPDNTQHFKQKNFYVPGRIRTRSPSKREAADSLLRPRDHRERP
jgi:hypothetical protein